MKVRAYLSLACISLALGSVLVACGDGGDDGDDGGNGGSPPVDSATAGKKIVRAKACGGCHGGDALSGGVTALDGAFPSNLTPDKDTGLGSWTDDQIAKAVTEGIDDKGEQLCNTMQKYSLNADEVADLIAYLRSLAPVKNQVSKSTCP